MSRYRVEFLLDREYAQRISTQNGGIQRYRCKKSKTKKKRCEKVNRKKNDIKRRRNRTKIEKTIEHTHSCIYQTIFRTKRSKHIITLAPTTKCLYERVLHEYTLKVTTLPLSQNHHHHLTITITKPSPRPPLKSLRHIALSLVSGDVVKGRRRPAPKEAKHRKRRVDYGATELKRIVHLAQRM